MRSPIIIALDVEDIKNAIRIVEELKDYVDIFKVGPVLFMKYGKTIIKEIKNLGKFVFLDLKFHDIPNTVKLAVKTLVEIDVDFATIHLSGGRNMVKEAVKASLDTNTKLLGVTVLTSISTEDLEEIGINTKLEEMVKNLAKIGIEEGISGIVCSPREIEIVRTLSKEVLIVTPGVRMEGENVQDQKRVLTPIEAIKRGANYIVMGRSILESENRTDKIKKCLEEVCLDKTNR
ncbi:MAG: orotidine-5'-phosphate decarboxylase [Thermosulfidibacteraceae bacterium]|jgi:orotidine-5'-phosphate decarboxylase